MRKIIAIILAVVMLAAMSIPAFAKTLADESNSDKSDTVPVTYTSSQGYEVEIPNEFALTDEDADGIANGSGTVTAKKAKLGNGKKLIVTVASANNTNMVDGYNWKLVEAAGADPIGYTIAVENTTNGGVTTDALTQGGQVLTYTSNAAKWANKVSTMNITTAYSNQAGTFSDTLTFTASVVNV